MVNPFDRMYESTPPWEIGRPQGFIENLLARGAFRGRVLDVGCGTGENALLLASRGFDVHGVDFSERAISMALDKAKARRLDVPFELRDALELDELDGTFDTLLDSGVFHVFTDETRGLYARNLASVSRPGTTLYLVCFSDREPNWGGPRRVSREEIIKTFGEPWHVEKIEPATYETLMHERGARAHLATITYIGRRASRDN